MIKKYTLAPLLAVLLISTPSAHAGWFDWFSFSDFSPKTAIITAAFTGFIASMFMHKQRIKNQELRNQCDSQKNTIAELLTKKSNLETILQTTANELATITMRNRELASDDKSSNRQLQRKLEKALAEKGSLDGLLAATRVALKLERQDHESGLAVVQSEACHFREVVVTVDQKNQKLEKIIGAYKKKCKALQQQQEYGMGL